MSKYRDRGAYHFEEFEKPTVYRNHVNAMLQELVHLEPFFFILDLGGGEGLIASKLVELGYGVDSWEVDPHAIGLAQSLKTPVRKGDMVRDAFPPMNDLVLAADSFEHLTAPDRDRVLKKCSDSGAKLAIYIPDRPDAHAEDQPSLDRMVGEAMKHGYKPRLVLKRFARYGIFLTLDSHD